MGVGSDLAQVLERLVAARREAQFQSAEELLEALHHLTQTSERCPACGRVLGAMAWKCACGRSLLPQVSWETIGGDAGHTGSVPSVPGVATIAWSANVGDDVVGGPVGNAGIVVVATRKASVVALDFS